MHRASAVARQGFTLVEMLVALAIFGMVGGLATVGIVSALRVQSLNEATSASQAKLRRITEVFTQELRSAVLGGIANTPYASDSDSISFALLDSAGVFPVEEHDDGHNSSFETSVNVQILASGYASADDLGLEGTDAMMVNNVGEAIGFRITNVTRNGGPGSIEYRVVHAGCPNTISYSDNQMTMISARFLGFRFDPDTGELFQKVGSDDEALVAWGLDRFELAYIYEDDSGTPHELATPLVDANGIPLRDGILAGDPVTLARIRLILGASVMSNGRAIARTYSGQVEMASNGTVALNRILTCN